MIEWVRFNPAFSTTEVLLRIVVMELEAINFRFSEFQFGLVDLACH